VCDRKNSEPRILYRCTDENCRPSSSCANTPPPRVHLRRLPLGFIGYTCHRKIQAWCRKYCGGSLKKEEMPIFIQSSCLTNLGSFYTRDPLPRFDSVDSANQSVKWVFAEPADETLVDGAIAFPTSGCGSLMQRTVITFRPPKGARRY